MKLQRQLIALAIAGALAVGTAGTVAAQTVYVDPAPQQPVVIDQNGNAYVAQRFVPEYPVQPMPAPDIIVGRGATDTSNGYMYETRPWRYRQGFNVNTTPGYMGEQNARP